MSNNEKNQLLDQALEWQAPGDKDWLFGLFKGCEKYFDVEYSGLENLDISKPVLFVSSHSLFSITDLLVFSGIWRQTGTLVRGLGDRLHYKVPVWRSMVRHLGVVLGDQTIAQGLLESGQSVLVFPGGAREVMKKRYEIHNLVWKKRTGFIRLAINAGVPIVPISVYGGDKVMDIVVDADDYKQTWLGKLAARTGILDDYWRGADELPPIAKGIGWTVLPKPQKVYVSYGKPIHFDGVATDDPAALMQAREKVSSEINRMMNEAKERDQSNAQPLWRRLMSNI
ncbi:acyltransferase family protein [Spongiibacter sp. KMU-158]|uniref:Acyltransferase family protein n=1 Tax=Spongiibacter pelagi TaxID=2760804 RepID=A0A927C2R5_9GAMM|nr:lysophospholipid acyltransferase family protein [Spongiibacter pelagi]MBD2860235.1 acyltransferase family protein [Spongiibacter pelagi]